MRSTGTLHSWVAMLCAYAGVWLAGLLVALAVQSNGPDGGDTGFWQVLIVVGLLLTAVAVALSALAVRLLGPSWGPVARGLAAAAAGAAGAVVLGGAALVVVNL